jgi:hypothetical protein
MELGKTCLFRISGGANPAHQGPPMSTATAERRDHGARGAVAAQKGFFQVPPTLRAALIFVSDTFEMLRATESRSRQSLRAGRARCMKASGALPRPQACDD